LGIISLEICLLYDKYLRHHASGAAAGGADYGIRDAFYLYFDLPLRNKLKSGGVSDYGIRDAFYLYFDLPLRNKLKSGERGGL
jgi:hypothetical protein